MGQVSGGIHTEAKNIQTVFETLCSIGACGDGLCLAGKLWHMALPENCNCLNVSVELHGSVASSPNRDSKMYSQACICLLKSAVGNSYGEMDKGPRCFSCGCHMSTWIDGLLTTAQPQQAGHN